MGTKRPGAEEWRAAEGPCQHPRLATARTFSATLGVMDGRLTCEDGMAATKEML